jgi:large subunit ribosomal protein L19
MSDPPSAGERDFRHGTIPVQQKIFGKSVAFNSVLSNSSDPPRRSDLAARFFPAETMNHIDKIEREQMKEGTPTFRPGDTVNVHSRVVEGGKERIQIFKGLVIGRHGSGINEAFTVRKISSGEGVERSFHVHSPKMAKVEVLKNGKVRRAKLNYLRSRLGKAATNLKSRPEKVRD